MKWTIFFLLNLSDFWLQSFRIFPFSPTKKPIKTGAILMAKVTVNSAYFWYFPQNYVLPYFYYQSLVRGNIIFVSGLSKVLEKKDSQQQFDYESRHPIFMHFHLSRYLFGLNISRALGLHLSGSDLHADLKLIFNLTSSLIPKADLVCTSSYHREKLLMYSSVGGVSGCG